MDTNYNDYSVNDINSSKETHHKFKFRFVDIFIFLLCIVAAFVFWCYALYVDDPVIEKEVMVNFILENGQEGDKLSQSSAKIVLYGELSLLAYTRYINVKIDRNQFDIYDHDTVVTFVLPDNFYCETNEVVLKLTNSSNK